MIAPIGAATFREVLQQGAEVYHALKAVLKKKGLATGLGDEGGFAPDLESNRAALDLIAGAIGEAGFKVGDDIALALDVAASEFADQGSYTFEQAALATEMADYYGDLNLSYPIVSIEDLPTRRTGRAGRPSPPSSATRSRSSATTCSSPTSSGSAAASSSSRPTPCW